MKCSTSLAFNLISTTRLINSTKHDHSFYILYLKGTVQALLDKKDDREIQDEVFKQLGEYLKSKYRGNDTRVEILEAIMLFEKSSVTRHTKINISCIILDVYNIYFVGGDLASNIYKPAHTI